MKLTLSILCLVSVLSQLSAQEPVSAQKIVSDIAGRYESVKGVECMQLVKGGGLELLKSMFNKQFGKSFMKGVTSITVIEYSDASDQTCQALRKDLEALLAVLDEFDLTDLDEISENEYAKCYAKEVDSNTISDFVCAIESESTKTIMYMAGVINVE